MRSIPGMVVLSPADDVEARAAVIAAYNYQGPVYLLSLIHISCRRAASRGRV